MAFKLSIVSPGGRAFEGTADSMVAPGVAGEFGVMTGHTPMMAATKLGIVRVRSGETTVYVVTGRGVCEVMWDGVNLLAASATRVETIDEAKAELERVKSVVGKG